MSKLPRIDEGANRVTFKIVYYGPGLAGRTTNVRYILHFVDPHNHAAPPGPALERIAELYYDMELGMALGAFKPASLGRLPDGKEAWFCLCVPPASIFRDVRRRICLKDVDGLVFVADSQRARFEANIESMDELRAHLSWHGVDLRKVPRVLQLNKRDMPDPSPVSELVRCLRVDQEPVVEANAASGVGVFESLKELAKQVLGEYCRTNRVA